MRIDPALDAGLRSALDADLTRLTAAVPGVHGQVIPGPGGGWRVELWAWNERIAADVASAAELPGAVADCRARIEAAAATGLLQDEVDVLEYVLRERGLRAGQPTEPVLRFCHRLTRAQAIARLELTRRRGLLFLDAGTERNAVLVAWGEGTWAVADEDGLALESFDGGPEHRLPLHVLDASGTTVERLTATVPVLPAAADLQDQLGRLGPEDLRPAMGRDPGTGMPCVAWREGADVHVVDYLVHTGDVDLECIEGFPPAHLLEGRARRWQDALRCPACEADLPWDDAALACACGARYPVEGGRPDFLAGVEDRPVHPEQPWAPNPTPKVLLFFLLKYPHGLVLDAGAGNGTLRADNLINLEVFGFENTTVVADGRRLPFRDGALDAVLSAAVLEHVPQPFHYTAELRRVLRPGGEVRIDAPFLVPYHACPDHYFNTTRSGLLQAAGGFRPVAIGVGPHQSPFVALQTMLAFYAERLADPAAFYAMTVGELLGAPPGAGPAGTRVTPERAHEVAAGLYLHAVRPADGPAGGGQDPVAG